MGRRLGSKTLIDSGKRKRMSEKLTQEQIKYIINAKRRNVTNADLGKEFGVSKVTMDRCVRDIVLLENTKRDIRATPPAPSPLAKLMDIPKAVTTVKRISDEFNVSPQKAAQTWLSMLDRVVESGLRTVQRRHDPKYNGIEDLNLGYAVSGDVTDGRSHLNGSKNVPWLDSALAEEALSIKELTQLMIMQAKMYMDIMPYYHPKLATVEPKRNQMDVEKMSKDEREKRMQELAKQIGYNIEKLQ